MPDYVTINCQQKSRIRHNRFKSTIQMKVGASVSNLKLVPYQGEMPYVFISYAHRDMDIVYSIINFLIAKGMRIWFDEGIDPGTEWDDNIAAHVQGCDSMIAFISANYLNSDNCRDELNYARDLKKDRLLIYLEQVELPAGMAMRMNRIQAINRYNYDRPEDFFNKLMRCQFLARSIEETESEQKETIEPEQNPETTKVDSHSLVEQGLKYLFGRGTEKNYDEAVRLFRLAAEQNDPDALYNLGRCYATGRGVPKDYGESAKWHRKAAELDQIASQNALGHMYLYGRPGMQRDPAEGAIWYRRAAMQNDSLAQASLGECYENGWGVPQNYPEAFTWYRKAAEGGIGCEIARYHLGQLYLNGNGVEKDYPAAIRWLQEAGSHPDAVNLLGYCYENGYGVIQNPEEAVALYRKAAEQGHVTAQLKLGNCYEDGIGVIKNETEAFEWYRKAAENTISFDHNGPLWNIDRKAARQGQKTARRTLAKCYKKGIGVTANEEEAKRWKEKADDLT